jgi:hypothetical protein
LPAHPRSSFGHEGCGELAGAVDCSWPGTEVRTWCGLLETAASRPRKVPVLHGAEGTGRASQTVWWAGSRFASSRFAGRLGARWASATVVQKGGSRQQDALHSVWSSPRRKGALLVPLRRSRIVLVGTLPASLGVSPNHCSHPRRDTASQEQRSRQSNRGAVGPESVDYRIRRGGANLAPVGACGTRLDE